MRKYLPALTTLLVMAIVITLLFQLTRKVSQGPGGAKAGSPDVVRIISPHNEGILTEFKQAFEAWHQEKYGAPCTIVWEDRGGASTNMQFILSEFKASPAGINVDVLWGGGDANFIKLQKQGCLKSVKLPDEILNALPRTLSGAAVYDPNFHWYGNALSSFGILYNRKRLAERNLPQPRTWEDLAQPEFFNEISAADPRQSGSAYAMVEIILQAYGWEKGFEVLTRMAGNVKRFDTASSAVTQDVSRQDVAAGLAIDFYAASVIHRFGPETLGFVLPENLTPITPDPIAAFTGGPNPVGAQRFIEFAMSPAGQALYVLPPGAPGGPKQYDLLRIPVIPAVLEQYTAASTAKYSPKLFETRFDYDARKAATRANGLRDLYGALFIDVSDDLRAAWQAVIRRGMKSSEVRLLCTPPVSESGLVQFSMQQWPDSVARNSKIAEWSGRRGNGTRNWPNNLAYLSAKQRLMTRCPDGRLGGGRG